MADAVPKTGGATLRRRIRKWILAIVAAGALVAVLSALDLFGGFVYETHGFMGERTQIWQGRTLILHLDGNLVEFDSAGRHVERYGTPYTANVYVRCDQPTAKGCRRAVEVREIGLTFTPRRGGATVTAPLAPLEVRPDSTTVSAQAEVPLPPGEHVAVVTVRVETDAGAHTDTVRLPLVPIYYSRTVSIQDWFSRL